jgi:hypothetical protein
VLFISSGGTLTGLTRTVIRKPITETSITRMAILSLTRRTGITRIVIPSRILPTGILIPGPIRRIAMITPGNALAIDTVDFEPDPG